MCHAANLAAALREAEECEELDDEMREHARERRKELEASL